MNARDTSDSRKRHSECEYAHRRRHEKARNVPGLERAFSVRRDAARALFGIHAQPSPHKANMTLRPRVDNGNMRSSSQCPSRGFAEAIGTSRQAEGSAEVNGYAVLHFVSVLRMTQPHPFVWPSVRNAAKAAWRIR